MLCTCTKNNNNKQIQSWNDQSNNWKLIRYLKNLLIVYLILHKESFTVSVSLWKKKRKIHNRVIESPWKGFCQNNDRIA